MKVYIVSEGNYGDIGVTKGDIPSVINYLLDNVWLTDDTKIWSEKLNQWISVRGLFGEHWQDFMLTWNAAMFNEYFVDVFYIEEYEVYGL